MQLQLRRRGVGGQLSWMALLLLMTLMLSLLLRSPSAAAADHPDASGNADAPSSFQREVHAFWYAWYGVPEFDGRYLHWNHSILQHWNPTVAAQWPKGVLNPPGDIGATFMPARGLYSSCDPATLRSQLSEARSVALIDVLVASWWPRGRPDGQGVDTDRCMKPLLDAAQEMGVRIAVHMEPYEGRTPSTVREDIVYLHEHYGNHPALHRFARRPGDKPLPVAYIYDSYLNPAEEWAALLQPGGAQSIRGTDLDLVAIGLLVEASHRAHLKSSGFDGLYTYFAAEGSTFGASTRNWKTIAQWAREDDMEFIPSVGCGYDDTRIRPWNAANRRLRERGAYYRRMWAAATSASSSSSSAAAPRIVSITSYNEWGEGTQIEPAVPFVTDKGEALQHYGGGDDEGPMLYLRLTAELARSFKQLPLPATPAMQQYEQVDAEEHPHAEDL